MTSSQIDPELFVHSLQPLLERRDLKGLMGVLRTGWSSQQIVPLLHSCNCDARKVAALALSLVGGRCCTPDLVTALKDHDPMVSQMAEHALWCIWFRSGAPEANAELVRGINCMDGRDFDRAIEHFATAIALDPEFGEAYNQRAIAHYLCEQYEQSLRDGAEAVRRVPCHFGAWAGMGHCHAHLGRLDEALRCYRRALSLHPHLECIRETVEALSHRVHQ